MSNYNLTLQPSYSSVFDVTNKGNSEIIMAVRYAEGKLVIAILPTYIIFKQETLRL